MRRSPTCAPTPLSVTVLEAVCKDTSARQSEGDQILLVSGDPAALAAYPSRYSGESEMPLGLVLTDTFCLNSAAGSSG
ncbi:hypothetical protein AV530_000054 [Patagioenas fasciata monilis]|uniref:Uncharacterized protein n=1 Tax=Patagioenas fasciata monilis TaxID=372326 RepID=A0A1V4K047_PATFA|nr:hypothetical protein AV530_000054 [Patagioenas fasciata monilis]